MNKQEKLQERRSRLMPGGVPRWIRCYDNEGETADLYTVVFSHAQSFYSKGRVPYLGMSSNPYHPQGIGMHGDANIWEWTERKKVGDWPPAIGRRGNLGLRISFEDLPKDCQRAVIDDYEDYWSLKE